MLNLARRIEVLLILGSLIPACVPPEGSQPAMSSGADTDQGDGDSDGDDGDDDDGDDDDAPGGDGPGDDGPGGSGTPGGSGNPGDDGPSDDGPSDDGPGDDDGEPCMPDGGTASSASACCSGELDDFDQCCSDETCCGPSNHSHATVDGYCACDDGWVWASDAPTDFTCVQPGDHVVSCTNQGVIDAMWCECTPQDNSPGDPVIQGSCHPDPSFAPMQCCADDGYPSTGSCECYLTQSWECMAFGDSCYCNYYWEAESWEYHTSVCDAVPEPDGTPWHCCASPYGSCNCEAWGGACDSGEWEVADCTDDISLGFTPFYGCDYDQTAVTDCEGGGAGGGQCIDSDDCPGECYGSDPFCCPSCEDGYCGTFCCNSSGVCF